jgi:hypothetical protein
MSDYASIFRRGPEDLFFVKKVIREIIRGGIFEVGFFYTLFSPQRRKERKVFI